MEGTVQTVRIYFDGGASPNPGKGYGSYSVDGGVSGFNHSSIRQQFGEPLTNNQAEYLSLIAALKWLRHHAHPFDTRLLIFTDSKLLQGQLVRNWRCKVPHLRELVSEAKQLLSPYRSYMVHWNSRTANVKRFGH
jgi:ribonuclease HI